MEFTEIEIELSNDLTAYVSGEYEPYYEDNRYDDEFGTADPGSGWIADEIKISEVEVSRDGEPCEDWPYNELEDRVREYLNKELEEYEP